VERVPSLSQGRMYTKPGITADWKIKPLARRGRHQAFTVY
jgi:hypothetical protein